MVALLSYISSRPAVPNDYADHMKTGGPVEGKYLQMGGFEVARLEIGAMQSYKKYLFYYPAEMMTTDRKYPVVVFCNGTGVTGSKYTAVLEHLASWGFVVAATEEEYSWNGFSAEMCIRRIMLLNDNEAVQGLETNPFYQHIDIDNVGIAGHSQGGVGAINAATDSAYAHMIKAVYCASPTGQELAQAMEWPYEPSKINAPVFLISATGDGDERLVVSLDGLTAIYNAVPDMVAKFMARRNDADHAHTLYYGDGYMTAWFMWQLKGDEEAAKAFVGENAELSKNEYWQDVRKNR